MGVQETKVGKAVSAHRVRLIVRFFIANTFARMFAIPPFLRMALYRRAGMSIGAHTYLFPGAVVRPGNIRIGWGCYINYGCVLDPGAASITIGNRVQLGPRVMLMGNTHEIGEPSSRAGRTVSSDIQVGDGCWLGAGVIVMPGVSIASGCVIGAGSLVTKDTAPNGIYVGAPARFVRMISDLDFPVSSASG